MLLNQDGARQLCPLLRSRMRRVPRGRDKPYAILGSFGGEPNGDFWVAESYRLEHLARVAQGLR